MKRFFYGLFLISILLGSCNGAVTSKKNNPSFSIIPNKAVYQLNERVTFDFSKNHFEEKIVSENYQIQGRTLIQTNGSYTLDSLKLGKHFLEATLTSVSGKIYKMQKEITILASESPQIYTYRIVKEYPHDPTAYTQGFEFFGDTLIESTGQYGASSLRKWDVFTGKVYKKIDLDKKYFGEGITVVDTKIAMLTWQENVGFVYDLELRPLSQFNYGKSKEGWGICYSGKKVYKSDGTEKIWILNPQTYQEEDFIQLCTDKSLFSNANELEWVNGKIYANTYQKDGIMIINPENGFIEGIVDVRGLKDKVEQTPYLDVLNGIAYHPTRKTFFITGKNWNKIFEVVFEKK